MLRLMAVLACAVLSGCAINQTVQPVLQTPSKEICVIENPAVSQEGFLPAYERQLKTKGYAVSRIPVNSPVTTCPTTSTYTANWRWDLALYMAYAEMKVFAEGKEVGSAIYDALRGGANMNKFIRAEEKIKELVDLLFP